jgi:hypothetical protein
MNNLTDVIDFPDHHIDPASKDEAWILKFGKAIMYDAGRQSHKLFWLNGGRYDEQTAYAMGKQSNAKYLTLSEIDEADEDTDLPVDFSVRGPAIKLMDILHSKVHQLRYAPVATPIDMTSRTKNDQLFAKAKAKLVMRQLLAQGDADLANSPMLQMGPGEPQDMEELEMRFTMGEQFNRSKDAELLISLALWENKLNDVLRKETCTDLRDHGVTVVKDGLNDNGRPDLRRVDLRYFVCNHCTKPDFSDMWYAGELIPVKIDSLSKHFNGQQIEQIKMAQGGLCGFFPMGPNNKMPTLMEVCGNRKTHALVFDFEFLSYDVKAWETGKSKYGNPQISRSNIEKASKRPDSHEVKDVCTLYRGKWIVGTDLIYNAGPAKNQKRSPDPRRMAKTSLSYKAFAMKMKDMVCPSYMDRMIPLIDDYMMNNIQVQKIRNSIIPNGFDIDMDALENVGINLSGKDMQPEDLLLFFRRKGILIRRGKGISNPNGKAINPTQNSWVGDLLDLYTERQNIKAEMKDDLGLNDITDGSTPKERTLNGVASLAMEGTNNAMYPLIEADRIMVGHLSQVAMFRVQQVIRITGDYSGFMPAINENTLMFVKADANLGLEDFAIMVEARPTNEQKEWLIGKMEQMFGQGVLDVSDAITVLNTFTLKQAEQILAYRCKKNKQLIEQNKIMQQQALAQAQTNSAIAAEQAKQQTLQVEYSLKSQLEAQIGQINIQIEKMRLDYAAMNAAGADHTKIESKHIEKAGKEQVARINKGDDDENIYEE